MQLLVKLKSADNVVVAVEEKVARLSGLVGSVLAQNDDGIPVEAISVPGTTAQTLQLVIAWCEYHKNDPDCLQNEYLANLDNLRNLPEWDEQWLSEQWDNSTLADIIFAAEQMKIPKLLYLARRMQRVRSARVNLLANNNNGPMELEEVEAEALAIEAGGAQAEANVEAPVAAAVAALVPAAPEGGQGGQEEAEVNDRHFPILHSQAIIEIGQMMR